MEYEAQRRTTEDIVRSTSQNTEPGTKNTSTERIVRAVEGCAPRKPTRPANMPGEGERPQIRRDHNARHRSAHLRDEFFRLASGKKLFCSATTRRAHQLHSQAVPPWRQVVSSLSVAGTSKPVDSAGGRKGVDVK